MRHLLCLASLAAATLLGSCSSGSSSSNPPGPSVMFWLDSGNLAIESFSTAHPALGDPVPIDRVVIGTSTRLSAAAAAAVLDTTGNRLFVANGTEILVFDNASAANGNMAPSRIIRKAVSDFMSVASLSLDTANNLLYVGDRNAGGAVPDIYVIGSASTATGSVTPVSITDNSASDRRFVYIDAANDILYVADTCQVSVFNVASTRNGPSTPDRQFANCPTLDSGDHPLWLDAGRDEIYVMNPSGADPGVMIFPGASAASGNVSPSRTIQGFPLNPGAVLRNIFLDTTVNDRLYVASTEAVFILDNASTLNGTLTGNTFPSQQLSGISGLDLATVAVNPTP
jgi:hypothetical protein